MINSVYVDIESCEWVNRNNCLGLVVMDLFDLRGVYIKYFDVFDLNLVSWIETVQLED